MFGLLSNTKIEKIGIHIIEKLALLCAHGVHYTVYTVDFFIAHHHIIITKLPQNLLNAHNPHQPHHGFNFVKICPKKHG